MTKLLRLLAVALIGVVGLAACDDDDGFDKAAFCKIAEEFQDSEGAPTDEQLDEYVEAAPDDIQDDAKFVAGKFKEAEGDIGAVFSDPDVGERIENIEEAESRECGIGDGDEEEGDGEDEEEPVTGPAEGANVVEITAVEYAFQGVPETTPAGVTALGFTNGGEALHEMNLSRLTEGTTLEEALAFEGDPEEAGLIEGVGHTDGAPGDETTYINAELTPGTYALSCFVPGPEGKSHAELGMVAQFTVA